MTARVSMLKSRMSLTCFRACFLPGRAKYLSAPRYSSSKFTGACDSNTPCGTVTKSNASFVGASAKLRKATVSFVLSVCPSARNHSAPTGRIFMEIDI